MQIIQNAVEVNDVIYVSRHVHDFVDLPDGRAIDGGCEYIRHIGSFEPEECLGLTDESTAFDVLNMLVWGTYGPSGTEPLHYVRIRDMSIEHLRAVYNHAYNLNPNHKRAMLWWLMVKEDQHEGINWYARNMNKVHKLVATPYNDDHSVDSYREIIENLRETLYYVCNAVSIETKIDVYGDKPWKEFVEPNR